MYPTIPAMFSSYEMEPLVGFEPTTHALRMRCSTPELQWRR